MAVLARQPMTVADYPAWSETRPDRPRYELLDGEMVAQAAERNRHVLVKSDVDGELKRAVAEAGLPCTVLAEGSTVVTDERTAFEPDAVVQCGRDLDLDAVTADAPMIVVEVVSPSAVSIDTSI